MPLFSVLQTAQGDPSCADKEDSEPGSARKGRDFEEEGRPEELQVPLYVLPFYRRFRYVCEEHRVCEDVQGEERVGEEP